MVKFLLYLFETGLCLSLLYAVYYFFLRKETFFNFNRVYLIGILIFSLLIPLLHVNIAVHHTDQINEPIQEIGKLRSYYSDFISLADEEFSFIRRRKYKAAVFEENDLYSYANPELPDNLSANTSSEFTDKTIKKRSIFRKIKLAEIILLVYFTGVLVFFTRFMVLLFWLRRMIANNQKSKTEEYSLVQLQKEVPPFSFFRYIFITKEATTLSEFEQVLAHEKVHVKQNHSLDLLVAHVISVFQWFNPLVWKLQKALKITHEYIADSNVVSQGFKLFDYQSLLLNQLISVKSVELINNFNLLSIKKRIAMMTKNKSGFFAKLKILLVIPAAIAIFLLFSDMTIQSPALSFSNFKVGKTSNLDGIWKNNNPATYGSLLYFQGNNLSVLESRDKVDVIDIKLNITDKALLFTYGFEKQEEAIKYEIKGNELKIWWNNDSYSVYQKTNYSNSFEALVPEKFNDIQLPKTNVARILEKQEYLYNIYVYPDKYFVEDVECNLNQLKETIQKRVAKFKVIDKPYITARIFVDKETEMKPMYELFQILRELQLYKIGYASLPLIDTSPLQCHVSAIPMMLPPKNAEILEVEKVNDKLFELVATDDFGQKKQELESFIKSHPDYIARFGWGNKTKYESYLAGIDMVFNVVYKLRSDYTSENMGIPYSELPYEMQKDAKNKYPMRLTQYNFDEE